MVVRPRSKHNDINNKGDANNCNIVFGSQIQEFEIIKTMAGMDLTSLILNDTHCFTLFEA